MHLLTENLSSALEAATQQQPATEHFSSTVSGSAPVEITAEAPEP